MEDLEYLRLLEAAVEHSFDAVVITTARLDRPGPEIVYANPAFCRMTGYSEDELIGRTPRILQGPRTGRALLDRLREALAHGQPFSARTVNYRKDGTPYDVEWSISPVRGPGGRVTHYVSVQRDVTAETRERVRREMLVYALDETSDNVVITDREVRILDVNKAFENHTGYLRDEVRGENPRILQSGMHDRAFYRRMWDTLESGDVFRATFTDRNKNGRLVHLEETITPVKDENGRISGYVSIGKDVSERVKAENELMRLATTDMLTGLTNRMHFETILREEIERSARYDHPLSLIMMDIDNFKRINDRHGHATGDEVLTHFARLVSANVRTPDTFARWGGEEFMLLTPETDVDQAMTMAEKLRQTVREETFPAVGTVTCSFGVVGVDTEKTPEAAIRQVDDRLYRAKDLGRDRVVAD
jgi:diguanylate cyclase (GGDEF)-like protein/PAS domain S-box-containing protein